MSEIYRDYRIVKDYPNYVVSNVGEVFNTTTNKMLKSRINTNGYLYYQLWKNNKGKTFLLHRLVAVHFIDNIENKKYIDHKDNNPLNNHLTNLRWCSQQENMSNTRIKSINTSSVKGVCFDKSRNKWKAQIFHNNKQHFLGRYDTLEEATIARQTKAREIFGEFINDCEQSEQ